MVRNDPSNRRGVVRQIDGMGAYSGVGQQRVRLDGFAGKHMSRSRPFSNSHKGHLMNNIVYIVGAVVIIIALLSFFGLR